MPSVSRRTCASAAGAGTSQYARLRPASFCLWSTHWRCAARASRRTRRRWLKRVPRTTTTAARRKPCIPRAPLSTPSDWRQCGGCAPSRRGSTRTSRYSTTIPTQIASSCSWPRTSATKSGPPARSRPANTSRSATSSPSRRARRDGRKSCVTTTFFRPRLTTTPSLASKKLSTPLKPTSTISRRPANTPRWPTTSPIPRSAAAREASLPEPLRRTTITTTISTSRPSAQLSRGSTTSTPTRTAGRTIPTPDSPPASPPPRSTASHRVPPPRVSPPRRVAPGRRPPSSMPRAVASKPAMTAAGCSTTRAAGSRWKKNRVYLCCIERRRRRRKTPTRTTTRSSTFNFLVQLK